VLWLTPVILATQETEIRRIEVQANSSRDPISKKTIKQKGLAEGLKMRPRVQAPAPGKKKAA
jgi:hypothetical protein